MKNFKQLRQEQTEITEATAAEKLHAAAIEASKKAKESPSVVNHRAASDAHEKAISGHEKAINALIKKDGSAEEVKAHEQHIKMHKNEAQKHRFAAHRFGKAQQNEGTVTETKWKVTFVHKHPEGEKKHDYVVTAPHQNAADKQAIALHQKAHPKGNFHMWNSEELYEAGLEDACWKGYEAIGMKMKNGRKVPNCVPKEGHAEDAQAAHQAAHAALKQGDVDTYHKEMDKKFASHQAAEKEASKKPVKTFESTESLDESAVHDLSRKAHGLSASAKTSSDHKAAADAHYKAAEAYRRRTTGNAAKFGKRADDAHDSALKHEKLGDKHLEKAMSGKNPVEEAVEQKPYDPTHPMNAFVQKRIHQDYMGYKNTPTKDLLRMHQNRYRVRGSYSAADAGGKHGLISGLLRHSHGDRHVAHYFGLKEMMTTDAIPAGTWCTPPKASPVEDEDTTTIEKPVAEESDEQKNLKITKHEKLAVEAGKKGDRQAQQYHLNIVKSLQNESVVAEAKEDKLQKHLVTVTVTDPQHAMATKRKEKIMKRVKVSAKDPKDAVAKAEAHYKKHGYKVHDSLHHSVVTESLDTDEFVDSYNPEQDLEEIRMAKAQLKEIADMAQDLVDAMEDNDQLEPWMQYKITAANKDLTDVYSTIAYGEDDDDDNSEEGNEGSEADSDGENQKN